MTRIPSLGTSALGIAALLASCGRLPAGEEPPAPAPEAKAFVRYVPERMDDVAWENDRIAYRVYGPALEKHEATGSGIDVWAKSTRKMIINEWYKGENYHTDHGDGLDFYDVKQSRGCGGLGVWDGDKLYVSRVWSDYKILQNGPDAASFRLTYAPWKANGRKVWEERTTTLAAGSNLNRIESTLDSDDPGDLVVGIGVASRKGEGKLVTDKEKGLLSYWQPPEKPGTIGCGVLVDPAQVVGFTHDALNNLVLIKATPGKPFVYYAGACWSKSGDFEGAADWERYLKEFRRQ